MDNSDEAFDSLTVPTLETTLMFGKHKGRSISYMIENHPGYMMWVLEEEIMDLPNDIITEIEDANFEDGREY